ncbi:MAG: hypothetical protein ACOCWD_01550 [Tangfeifania sp.]
MQILAFLLSVFLIFGSGKPAEKAVVFIESNKRNQKPIAHQITGETGKAAFRFLDEGNYRMLIDFPQQDGKWTEEKSRHYTITKSTYNPKNKTYYYKGEEGYFFIKFSRLRKIDSEGFKPVFREIKQKDNSLINLLDFKTRKNRGQIQVKIGALTARQFKRKTDKIEQDISEISIPGQI